MDALNTWLHTDEQKFINLLELYWMCPERQGDGKYERDAKNQRREWQDLMGVSNQGPWRRKENKTTWDKKRADQSPSET